MALTLKLIPLFSNCNRSVIKDNSDIDSNNLTVKCGLTLSL